MRRAARQGAAFALLGDFLRSSTNKVYSLQQTPAAPDEETELEAFISGLVASGRYSSQDAVLREAVRLFQERKTQLAAPDAAIGRGLGTSPPVA